MNDTPTMAPVTRPETIQDMSPKIDASRKRLVGIGVLVIVLAFGALGTWAAISPIMSAAVAPAVVKVASERKTVQHLEGGIVKEILVKEGQEVSAGQRLIRLEDTAARARHELLLGQHDALAAQMARLEAELSERSTVSFPPDLLNKRGDVRIRQLLAGEHALFNSRRAALQSQINLLGQRNQQYDEKIIGLNAQMSAAKTKIEFIREELKAAESLLEQGMYTKPRYYALQRTAADLDGEIGRLRADIAEINERKAESDMRIINLRQEAQKEANDKLQAVRNQLNDMQERLSAAADILARTDIVAPQAGTVIGLQLHTVGGVIKDGAPILDIVPKNDPLIVEARVRTDDIDVVHKDLPAEVRFTALNWRTTPVLPGKVTRVSADRFTDPQRGEAYYLAQIEVNPKSLAGFSLTPGMPAEVYIITGQRTPLEYLLKPLKDQMRRGLLEE
jgi:HlyD family type I secretion membrane fusion protein